MSRRIKEILMSRDRNTAEEAEERIADVRDDINAAVMNGSLEEIEDIIMNELGLEPDFVDDFIL